MRISPIPFLTPLFIFLNQSDLHVFDAFDCHRIMELESHLTKPSKLCFQYFWYQLFWYSCYWEGRQGEEEGEKAFHVAIWYVDAGTESFKEKNRSCPKTETLTFPVVTGKSSFSFILARGIELIQPSIINKWLSTEMAYINGLGNCPDSLMHCCL